MQQPTPWKISELDPHKVFDANDALVATCTTIDAAARITRLANNRTKKQRRKRASSERRTR